MAYQKKDISLFIRNFTFGVEDSLVSTVGLLTGIAAANVERSTIVLTGLVLIFVEAFSMGVGSLLSEHSVEEYEEKKQVPLLKSFFPALVMFVSYVVSGLIPLLPYVWLGKYSILTSILLTLIALFALGFVNAKMLRIKGWRDAVQTLIIGGLAILVGILVGQISQKI